MQGNNIVYDFPISAYLLSRLSPFCRLVHAVSWGLQLHPDSSYDVLIIRMTYTTLNCTAYLSRFAYSAQQFAAFRSRVENIIIAPLVNALTTETALARLIPWVDYSIAIVFLCVCFALRFNEFGHIFFGSYKLHFQVMTLHLLSASGKL